MIEKINKKKLIRDIFFFGCIGIVAAFIHYSTAYIVAQHFDKGLQLANALGFSVGFVFSYLGQCIVTFHNKPTFRSFFQYIILGCINYSLSALIIFFLQNLLPNAITLLIVVATIPIFSYFVSRHFIFTHSKK